MCAHIPFPTLEQRSSHPISRTPTNVKDYTSTQNKNKQIISNQFSFHFQYKIYTFLVQILAKRNLGR